MLRSTQAYRWFGLVAAVLLLLNAISPTISWTTFSLQFDKHLFDCQEYRQHSQSCQASCILKEMMPEQLEAISDMTISIIHSFSNIFVQNHQVIIISLLGEQFIESVLSHYLMLYSTPDLGMLSPPPQAK